MSENDTLQEDEIQALSAIYDDAWSTVDKQSQTYNICISIPNVDDKVNFQVTLPSEYPTSMPPYYQLSAPWLKGSARLELSSALDDLYWDNVGESIIYLWVERVRDFLRERFDQDGDINATVDDTTEEEPEATYFERDFISAMRESAEETCPPIVSGEPVTVKRSTFQAHVARVVSLDQVNQVLLKLKTDKKIAHATHNISAYRIYKETSKTHIQDNDDDGETHAGSRILHLLQILDVRNVLVVVTRWYGGVKLGPDRFRHINNCARSILVQAGFVKDSPISLKKK